MNTRRFSNWLGLAYAILFAFWIRKVLYGLFLAIARLQALPTRSMPLSSPLFSPLREERIILGYNFAILSVKQMPPACRSRHDRGRRCQKHSMIFRNLIRFPIVQMLRLLSVEFYFPSGHIVLSIRSVLRNEM